MHPKPFKLKFHSNQFAELNIQLSVIKSSPSNYFNHNLQLRLHLELFSSIHTDLYLDCDHSNRLVDLYSKYSVVISSRFRGIRKYLVVTLVYSLDYS